MDRQPGQARRTDLDLPRRDGGDGGERARLGGGAHLRSDTENALYVKDEFRDADAESFHLTQTGAAHFPDLIAIATPGPFLFLGDVPDELQQATEQMQLGGEFAAPVAGFAR